MRKDLRAADLFPVVGVDLPLQFLDALGGRWNISLFPYRNHGADFGRVLVAFEVPAAERPAFEAFLSGLGYRFQFDENNDAYRRFLGGAAAALTSPEEP